MSDLEAYHATVDRILPQVSSAGVGDVYDLGVALLQVGRLQEAVDVWKLAVERFGSDPDVGEMHGFLGEALMGLGRLEEAKAALELSVGADPEDPDAHAALGEVLARQGDVRRARAAFEEALHWALGGEEAAVKALEWLAKLESRSG